MNDGYPVGKPWWRSKTLWFNLVALMVAVATAFGYGEFEPSPEVQQWALVIVTVVNLVLRLVTRQPITR